MKMFLEEFLRIEIKLNPVRLKHASKVPDYQVKFRIGTEVVY